MHTHTHTDTHADYAWCILSSARSLLCIEIKASARAWGDRCIHLSLVLAWKNSLEANKILRFFAQTSDQATESICTLLALRAYQVCHPETSCLCLFFFFRSEQVRLSRLLICSVCLEDYPPTAACSISLSSHLVPTPLFFSCQGSVRQDWC